MRIRLHALLLSVFRRIPQWLRRRIIHSIAPSFTVGAVAVLRSDSGQLLLLRERHHSGWSLPGGLLGRGEEPSAALVRELSEEIGVMIERDSVGTAVPFVDAQVRRLDLVFTLALPPGADVSAQEPEVLEARWFAPDALPELFTPTAQVLDALGVVPIDATG
jgi:8-oxo-dGTP diphosphatase